MGCGLESRSAQGTARSTAAALSLMLKATLLGRQFHTHVHTVAHPNTIGNWNPLLPRLLHPARVPQMCHNIRTDFLYSMIKNRTWCGARHPDAAYHRRRHSRQNFPVLRFPTRAFSSGRQTFFIVAIIIFLFFLFSFFVFFFSLRVFRERGADAAQAETRHISDDYHFKFLRVLFAPWEGLLPHSS